MGLLINPYGFAAAAFNPATLFSGGAAGAFYDISDISTLWKDTAGTSPVTADGDIVKRVDDKSGNGNHLTEATNGPTYRVAGALKRLQFDGSNDKLRATFAMGTTWDRVSGLRPVTRTFPNQLLGGVTTNACLYYPASGIDLMIFNAASNGPAVAISANTDYVITERWSAAPCQLAKDTAAYVNSPSVAGVNPGGLTVGASNSSGDFAAFHFYGAVMINGAQSSGDITSLRTFMGALQGRVI